MKEKWKRPPGKNQASSLHCHSRRLFSPMEVNQAMLNVISSDDDHHPLLTAGGGGGDDDVEWLRRVLNSVSNAADVSDDVVFLGEYKPPSLSKPKLNVDDDDDDDCVILDGDPDKPVQVNGGGGDGDDDVCVTGQTGKIACRDFAHSRHLCAKFRFNKVSHQQYCEMCHCYVCDSPAPCPFWGTGASSSDHCHATDEETTWNSLRKTFRERKNGPPSVAKVTVPLRPLPNPQPNQVAFIDSLPPTSSTQQNRIGKVIVPPHPMPTPQPNQVAFLDSQQPTSSILQSRITRSVPFRACSSSTEFTVSGKTRRLRCIPPKSGTSPQPSRQGVDRQLKCSSNGVCKPSCAPSTKLSNCQQLVSNALSKNQSVYGSSNNSNYTRASHSSINNSPISMSKSTTPSRQKNSHTGSVDRAPSKLQVSSQNIPPLNHMSTIQHQGNQNQSQNIADSAFPKYSSVFETISGKGNQHQGTGSNPNPSSCRRYSSMSNQNSQTQYSDNQSANWFSLPRQSGLVASGYDVPADPSIFSPDQPNSDADLNYFVETLLNDNVPV